LDFGGHTGELIFRVTGTNFNMCTEH